MANRQKPSELEQGNWYFLSFVDRTKNVQLGACNLRVPKGRNPISYAHELGVNPGGEALAYPVEEPEPEMKPNRFYSAEEMKSLGY